MSVYTLFYVRSVSLKAQEGNIITHKTLRKLKFHLITVFMERYANLKTTFPLYFFFGLSTFKILI